MGRGWHQEPNRGRVHRHWRSITSECGTNTPWRAKALVVGKTIEQSVLLLGTTALSTKVALAPPGGLIEN